jgi:hypothetical protein
MSKIPKAKIKLGIQRRHEINEKSEKRQILIARSEILFWVQRH